MRAHVKPRTSAILLLLVNAINVGILHVTPFRSPRTAKAQMIWHNYRVASRDKKQRWEYAMGRWPSLAWRQGRN